MNNRNARQSASNDQPLCGWRWVDKTPSWSNRISEALDGKDIDVEGGAIPGNNEYDERQINRIRDEVFIADDRKEQGGNAVEAIEERVH